MSGLCQGTGEAGAEMLSKNAKNPSGKRQKVAMLCCCGG